MSSAMQCHSPFNFSQNCKNKAKHEMNIYLYKVLGGIEASGFLYSGKWKIIHFCRPVYSSCGHPFMKL